MTATLTKGKLPKRQGAYVTLSYKYVTQMCTKFQLRQFIRVIVVQPPQCFMDIIMKKDYIHMRYTPLRKPTNEWFFFSRK